MTREKAFADSPRAAFQAHSTLLAWPTATGGICVQGAAIIRARFVAVVYRYFGRPPHHAAALIASAARLLPIQRLTSSAFSSVLSAGRTPLLRFSNAPLLLREFTALPRRTAVPSSASTKLEHRIGWLRGWPHLLHTALHSRGFNSRRLALPVQQKAALYSLRAATSLRYHPPTTCTGQPFPTTALPQLLSIPLSPPPFGSTHPPILYCALRRRLPPGIYPISFSHVLFSWHGLHCPCVFWILITNGSLSWPPLILYYTFHWASPPCLPYSISLLVPRLQAIVVRTPRLPPHTRARSLRHLPRHALPASVPLPYPSCHTCWAFLLLTPGLAQHGAGRSLRVTLLRFTHFRSTHLIPAYHFVTVHIFTALLT